MFVPGELYYLKRLNYIWLVQPRFNRISWTYHKYQISTHDIKLNLSDAIMFLKRTPYDECLYVFLYGTKTLNLHSELNEFYYDWERI
jgi:hypothetical protein